MNMSVTTCVLFRPWSALRLSALPGSLRLATSPVPGEVELSTLCAIPLRQRCACPRTTPCRPHRLRADVEAFLAAAFRMEAAETGEAAEAGVLAAAGT
jgi:hypothetical protein